MATDMTPEVRAELRRLAGSATMGPWHSYVLDHETEARVVGDGWVVAQCASMGAGRVGRDARFIAAANPATVLALLDALDAAERERDEALEELQDVVRAIERWRPLSGCVEVDVHEMVGAIATAQAELDDAREVLAEHEWCDTYYDDAHGVVLNHCQHCHEIEGGRHSPDCAWTRAMGKGAP